MTKSLVSIIIPCFNALKYTKLCLKSILTNTSFNYELILINNGSSDGTKQYFQEIKEKISTVKYLKNLTVLQFDKNLGVAKALNTGIKISKGNYICYLNNDVIVSEKWLNNLTNKMKQNNKIAIIGTLFNAYEDKQFVKLIEKDLKEVSRIANFISLKNRNKLKKAKTIHGLCMLIRKNIFKKVGLFNENFYPCFGEDIEFCNRLKKAGYILADAQDVFVFHYWNKSVRSKEFNKENYSIEKVMDKNRKKYSIPKKYKI